MLKFENGDILLTANEYKNLKIKGGNASTDDLLNHTSKYIDLYYKLLEITYTYSAVNFNRNAEPEIENFYRISEKEYKIYTRMRELIARFDRK